MEFGLTAAQLAFRKEVADFFDRELPPGWLGIVDNGDRCSDATWVVERQMAEKLARKGWLALSWPKEHGGQGKSPIECLIFKEEMEYRGSPGVDIWADMVVAALLHYGTEEQRRRFLPPTAQASIVWCQCFSEPDAGSDLASLTTRAERKGEQYIINGEKTWVSGGHRAHWAVVLARTDPNLPRHRGLSYLLVPMDSPGIRVIGLQSLAGFRQLNRVIFDNVAVPTENLVGKENTGWTIATTTLAMERSGIERIVVSRRFADRIVAFVKERDCPDHLLQKLTQLLVEIRVGRLLAYRVGWLQEQGQEISAAASVAKVFGSELMQRVSRVAMEIAGSYGRLARGSELAVIAGGLAEWHASNVGRTFGAGTSEIQKNIIAGRGLGLPRE